MPSKSFFPERNRPNVLVGPNHQWQEGVASCQFLIKRGAKMPFRNNEGAAL
jgi:hypothetical protein